MPDLLGNPDSPIKKKYFIFSDLHLEFKRNKEEEKSFWASVPEHEEAEVCLCAGDVTNVGRLSDYRHFQQLCSRFKKVIYVPGNHEYYGSNPTDVSNRLQVLEQLEPKLKVLRAGEPYVYEGQRFIGDTMWFPDRPEVHIYRRLINDSYQIKELFPWAFTQSSLFMLFIKDNIRPTDIVITHHIPTDQDTSPIYKNGPTEAYFLNKNCERYIQNPNSILPKAWIYGHTHDKHDYYIENTRFICNPVGYSSECNSIKSCLYEL